jgi:leucine dehydrogenase
VIEELIRTWDGDHVVSRFDRPSGAWMFICVHSRRRGPAGGGTRMKTYADPADALADAMRLSAAMTVKMAVADLPFGGGKAVLAVPAVPEGAERIRLLHRYAEVVASLAGDFYTGPDMNTSPADMDVISERCSYVYCRTEAHGGSGDPGPYTARGVFHGIRATVRDVFGSPDLTDRVVLVQGVGDVGAPLASLLADAKARVLVADVVADRAATLADRIGAEVVPPDAAIGTECEVYAPCALGGTVGAATIPRLRCRIVAGSANNQLADPGDADLLRRAGIRYAPDFVINAGGALNAIAIESLGWSRETTDARLAGIGDTLAEIYAMADAGGITTEAAAQRLATDRLATDRLATDRRS